MKARHKVLGDLVRFKMRQDFLGRPMYVVTFKDGSTSTMESRRFNETFEIL